MKNFIRYIVVSLLLVAGARAGVAGEPTAAPADGYPRFALGADVSWTPYIESNRLHTYYKGETIAPDEVTDIPAMVYDHGIDAVRLRVWVDPNEPMALSGFKFKAWGYTYEAMSTFGTCSADELTVLAKRFAKQGQRVMISFQLSDTWADPGRQFIPRAWLDSKSVDDLSAHAVDYVTDVLRRLRDENVNVAWVQIGNETNNGMLRWPLPAADGAAVETAPYGCEIAQTASGTPSRTTYNFVKVFGDVAAAAREVYPEVKTVLHLTKTADRASVDWTLNLLRRAGFSSEICDYVGLSLYPGLDDGDDDYTANWRASADRGIATIRYIATAYGFRTILCEIGMNNEYSLSANTVGVAAADLQGVYIEQCNRDVSAFTDYLLAELATDASTCDGLFYWEPETDYMKNYKKGACVSATPGIDWLRDKVTPNAWWSAVQQHSSFPAGGLVEYTVPDGAVPGVSADSADTPAEYYTLQGIRVEHPSSGLYIKKCGSEIRKIVIHGY